MSDRLQPSRLRDRTEYRAALRELEELFLCDPASPAGQRFDQLVALIDEFDSRAGSPRAAGEDQWVDGAPQRDPLDTPERDLAREATIRR